MSFSLSLSLQFTFIYRRDITRVLQAAEVVGLNLLQQRKKLNLNFPISGNHWLSFHRYPNTMLRRPPGTPVPHVVQSGKCELSWWETISGSPTQWEMNWLGWIVLPTLGHTCTHRGTSLQGSAASSGKGWMSRGCCRSGLESNLGTWVSSQTCPLKLQWRYSYFNSCLGVCSE